VSFGPTNTAKTASNNLAGVANTATDASSAEMGTANKLVNAGQPNISSGTNFFNTLLNGNQADTTALLQPNINQIKAANQNALQSSSTLLPRGGGRAGSLFSSTYAPSAQIQSLFNTTRSNAAQPLIAAGLQQQGLGTNLFSTANQPLNTAVGANNDQLQNQIDQQRLTNQLWSGLGSGLFNLATLPLTGPGGGANLFGKVLGG